MPAGGSNGVGGSLTAAYELDDFDLRAVIQGGGGPVGSFYDGAVEFGRNAVWFQIEGCDDVEQGGFRWKVVSFAVDCHLFFIRRKHSWIIINFAHYSSSGMVPRPAAGHSGNGDRSSAG